MQIVSFSAFYDNTKKNAGIPRTLGMTVNESCFRCKATITGAGLPTCTYPLFVLEDFAVVRFVTTEHR